MVAARVATMGQGARTDLAQFALSPTRRRHRSSTSANGLSRRPRRSSATRSPRSSAWSRPASCGLGRCCRRQTLRCGARRPCCPRQGRDPRQSEGNSCPTTVTETHQAARHSRDQSRQRPAAAG
jgi:hypothetical protein